MDGKMKRRAQPVRKTTPMESRNRPRLTRIREPETSRPRDDECVVAERPPARRASRTSATVSPLSRGERLKRCESSCAFRPFWRRSQS